MADAPGNPPRHADGDPPRLHPAPGKAHEVDAPFHVPPGLVTIDQYLALRSVPEHRRAARRAFAGEIRMATVDEFDLLFSGVQGPR